MQEWERLQRQEKATQKERRARESCTRVKVHNKVGNACD